MTIKQEEIEKLLKEGFPDAEIEIQDLAGDDNHFAAKIRSSSLRAKIEFNNIKWLQCLKR